MTNFDLTDRELEAAWDIIADCRSRCGARSLFMITGIYKNLNIRDFVGYEFTTTEEATEVFSSLSEKGFLNVEYADGFEHYSITEAALNYMDSICDDEEEHDDSQLSHYKRIVDSETGTLIALTHSTF